MGLGGLHLRVDGRHNSARAGRPARTSLTVRQGQSGLLRQRLRERLRRLVLDGSSIRRRTTVPGKSARHPRSRRSIAPRPRTTSSSGVSATAPGSCRSAGAAGSATSPIPWLAPSDTSSSPDREGWSVNPSTSGPTTQPIPVVAAMPGTGTRLTRKEVDDRHD